MQGIPGATQGHIGPLWTDVEIQDESHAEKTSGKESRNPKVIAGYSLIRLHRSEEFRNLDLNRTLTIRNPG